MTLAIRPDDRDPGTLHLQGVVDATNVADLVVAVTAAIAGGGADTMLDLTELATASPRLLAALEDLAVRAAAAHQTITLRLPDDHLRELADANLPGAIRIERTRAVTTGARLPRAPVLTAPGPTAGIARREGRGFIASYGADRLCAQPGCTTKLSR